MSAGFSWRLPRRQSRRLGLYGLVTTTTRRSKRCPRVAARFNMTHRWAKLIAYCWPRVPCGGCCGRRGSPTLANGGGGAFGEKRRCCGRRQALLAVICCPFGLTEVQFKTHWHINARTGVPIQFDGRRYRESSANFKILRYSARDRNAIPLREMVAPPQSDLFPLQRQPGLETWVTNLAGLRIFSKKRQDNKKTR